MAEGWILFKAAVEMVADRLNVSIGEAQTVLRALCAAGKIRAVIRGNAFRTTISPDEWNGYEKVTQDGHLVYHDDPIGQRGLNWYWPIELNEADFDHWLDRNAPQVKPPAPHAEPGGRPEEHDWEEARLYALKLLSERGDPTNEADQVKGWKSKTDLAKAVLNHLKTDPDLSTVRGKVPEWLAEFHKAQVAQN
jgi:hypothetical protein